MLGEGYNVTPPGERNNELGWCVYTLTLGEAKNYESVQDILFNYSVGQWKVGPAIEPDYNGSKALSNHAFFANVGENADGEAFVSFIHEEKAQPNVQYNFVALTKHNETLNHAVHRNYGRPETKIHTFQFNCSLADVKEFQLRTRPIKSVRYSKINKDAKRYLSSNASLHPQRETSFQTPQETPSQMPPPNVYEKEILTHNGETPPTFPPPAESEEGFTSLFNGKNLDGWIVKGIKKDGSNIEEAKKELPGWDGNIENVNDEGWDNIGPSVNNGVLMTDSWDYWAILTEDTFKNFILRFDVKFYLNPKPASPSTSKSGILIHKKLEDAYKSETCEIQLAEKVEWDESQKKYVRVMLPPKEQTGAIMDKVPPLEFANKPLGEWNSVEIKYVNAKVWVTINGTLVQDGVDLSQIPGLNVNKEGHIAIQREEFFKPVYYKNIRIKRLP